MVILSFYFLPNAILAKRQPAVLMTTMHILRGGLLVVNGYRGNVMISHYLRDTPIKQTMKDIIIGSLKFGKIYFLHEYNTSNIVFW